MFWTTLHCMILKMYIAWSTHTFVFCSKLKYSWRDGWALVAFYQSAVSLMRSCGQEWVNRLWVFSTLSVFDLQNSYAWEDCSQMTSTFLVLDLHLATIPVLGKVRNIFCASFENTHCNPRDVLLMAEPSHVLSNLCLTFQIWLSTDSASSHCDGPAGWNWVQERETCDCSQELAIGTG